MKFSRNDMKSFILKSAIIFLFALLLFRFTIVSIANEYEAKMMNLISSSNFQEIKINIRESLKENNNKDRILDTEDAKLLGNFIKKILKELDLDK